MRKNIVFMGSDIICLNTLNYLFDNQGSEHCLAGIISNQDKPSGRGFSIRSNPVSEFAKNRNIPLHTPKKPNEETINWIKEKKTDLIIVIAYGHLLRPELYDLPKLKTINIHGSILPKYRGCSPISTAILNGDKTTGVTLMQIVQDMDAGPLCATEIVEISSSETTETLREKLSEASVVLFKKHLSSILSGNAEWKEQDHKLATYTKRINKQDGLIDFKTSANFIERQTRAYDPWPGTFFLHKGIQIKVRNAQVFKDIDSDCTNFSSKTNFPGQIIPKLSKNLLAFQTADGIIAFSELQKPGGKWLSADTFLNGFKFS